MHALIGSQLMRRTAMLLVLVMGLLALAPRVEAGFAPSGLGGVVDLRAQDLTSLQKSLEHKVVKERLATLGYSQDEIAARLGQLSDADLHSLANQFGALDAGGDGIGVVIGVLVIVLLALLIYKLYDKTITIN